MDLNRNNFLLFKTVMTGSTLLLQLIAIKYLGTEFTGSINRYQLLALSLSIFIFPGLEMSLIRFLPVDKQDDISSYKHNISNIIYAAKIIYLASVFLSLLYLTFNILSYDPGTFINDGIIVISLMLFLFNCRIVPLIFRLERNMVGSILTEPSILSTFAILVILITEYTDTYITPGMILCISTIPSILIALSLIKTLPAGADINNDNSMVKQSITNWMSLIKDKYSSTFALISASNYSILWGLATLGSLILPAHEVAIYVTILRVIGILLFIEGAVVAYYLPILVREIKMGKKAKEFDNYRHYMTFGTITTGILLSFTIYIFDIFSIISFEFFSIIMLTLIQMIISLLGSPFAVAAATIKESNVKKMSIYILSISAFSVIALLLFPDWRVIIIAFAIQQSIRCFLGYRSLLKQMDKTEIAPH